MTSARLAGPTVVPWTALTGTKLERVPEGDYGVVRITAGRFKGFLGLRGIKWVDVRTMSHFAAAGAGTPR